MVRPYEVVYIFDSALEEPAINERLARFHSLIQQQGAEPPQVNHWGKRTLAYPIRSPAGVRAGHQARRGRAAVPGGSP
jgi:ribosomal protein S6